VNATCQAKQNGLQDDELREIADALDMEAQGASRGLDVATRRAIAIGRLLAEARPMMERGQWCRWVANRHGLGLRTAQGYRRLFERLRTMPADEAHHVARMPLRQALRAVAGTKAPRLAPP
jgi:hypothetical protein